MKYIKLLLGLLAIAASGSLLGAAQKSPNIVVILADDFGYGSTNAYGADIKHVRTPNINRLAKEGIKFTDANSAGSVCSPTRYAFMTGRYAWRGKLKYGVLLPPEGPLMVEDEILTLPEYLQEQGYETAHIGKWHLGYTNLPNVDDMSAQPLTPGPRSMGFDYHFAVPNQIDWLPKVYVENESIVGLRSVGTSPYGKSFYDGGKPYYGYDAPQRVAKEVTQDLSNMARKWIRSTVRENPEKPFFLYFAPVAVHHPISPSEAFRGTSGVGAYGDFIHDLDNSVGDILDALAYAGVLDDTLVIFTSDNGGDFCPEEQQARELGFKNNGDLRGDKHLIYQGGFRVPFVARWPGVIEEGRVSDRMISVTDLYSTFQDIISGKVSSPKEKAPDSFSFYSELRGEASADDHRETMVMNDVKGIVAIRKGEWKYIENKAERPSDKARQAKNPKLAKPMLFNLKADSAEQNDVIDQFPEIAKEMQIALDQIRSKGSERLAAGK